MLEVMPSDTSKPHRAWPEFAGMPDAQADAIYRRAKLMGITRAEMLESTWRLWRVLACVGVCFGVFTMMTRSMKEGVFLLLVGIPMTLFLSVIRGGFATDVDDALIHKRVRRILQDKLCACGCSLKNIAPIPGSDPPHLRCPECGFSGSIEQCMIGLLADREAYLRSSLGQPATTARVIDRFTPFYRAFPEFDAFTDEECERWMRLSWRYRPRQRLLIAMMIPLGIAIASIPIIAPVLTILFAFDHSQKLLALSNGAFFAVLIVFALLPGIATVVVSFRLRDRWLRDCLRSLVGDRRCTCGYSLLGLPEQRRPTGSVIVCPECGKHVQVTVSLPSVPQLAKRTGDKNL